MLRSTVLSWLPAFATAGALLVLWEVSVRVLEVQRWLLPAPTVIFRELFDSLGLLTRHAGTTLVEIVVGFAVSIWLGVVIASGVVWSRTVERSVYPIIIASQTIPIFTLAPLLIIWVGTDIMSKVIVVVLFTFFPIVVSLVTGFRSVDREMIDMFRTLGASPFQTFRKLVIPTALPNFFGGLKVAAVVSVIGAVIGEWVGASAGLGWLMKLSGPQFQTARVFAAIVVLSVLAIGLFLAVVVAEKWSLRKYPARAVHMKGLGEL
ncbi:MAG: ABC transporter permease [Chloroflexi bacterium]|nr:ABC transporter permease [Chloroflexota bacterium]